MSESVIYRTIGDEGVIEITQDRSQRTLYLGNDAKQSCVDLHRPHRLVLSYTRAMMSCLMFLPTPRRVLLVGLGGGSLARFLMHHFPDCQIDAIELRPGVVKLAHGYFMLPEQDNLAIHVAEARSFLSRGGGRFEHYDLILVDAFNHDGVAPSVQSESFITACRQRLSAGGIFTINLWNHPCATLRDVLDMIDQGFAGNRLLLPVIDKGNLIVHAAHDKTCLQLASAKAVAKQLETLMEDMGFSQMLRQLRRANRWHRLGQLMGWD